jgi:thiamine pyrophosphokinase
MSTILVFTGGGLPEGNLTEELPTPDLVVAADSGYDLALHLGYRVDVLVGDMDSIAAVDIPDQVLVERHPTDKDQTDLDLAMEFALGKHPRRVVVIGGTGGRFDHEMATSGLLCSDRWAVIDEIDWVSSRGRAHVVRGRRIVHGDVGTTLSLIPFGGTARVTTKGLEWDLSGDDLAPGSTWGVSNVLRAPVADIRVESGCVLVVLPT